MSELITVGRDNNKTSVYSVAKSEGNWKECFMKLKNRHKEIEELDKIYTELVLHELRNIGRTLFFKEEMEDKLILVGSSIYDFHPCSIEIENYGTCVLEPSIEIIESTRDLETDALYTIRKKFRKITEVDSIHVQRYRSELKIQIPISISQYDKKVMIELFEIEYDIRKKYNGIVFNFSYPPIGVVKKEDFLHPEAVCIYEK